MLAQLAYTCPQCILPTPATHAVDCRVRSAHCCTSTPETATSSFSKTTFTVSSHGSMANLFSSSRLSPSTKQTKSATRRSCQLPASRLLSSYPPLIRRRLACRYGHDAAASLLISCGARVDLRDVQGAAALHHACAGCSVACVAVLLDAGAEADAVDFLGRTALHVACRHVTLRCMTTLPLH